jgi:hypothetical protein
VCSGFNGDRIARYPAPEAKSSQRPGEQVTTPASTTVLRLSLRRSNPGPVARWRPPPGNAEPTSCVHELRPLTNATAGRKTSESGIKLRDCSFVAVFRKKPRFWIFPPSFPISLRQIQRTYCYAQTGRLPFRGFASSMAVRSRQSTQARFLRFVFCQTCRPNTTALSKSNPSPGSCIAV